MKVLSLFDGIGCGRLALKRSNVTVTYYGASEIDSHAIDVAKRNHPDIDHIGDVKTISDHPCDLLIGGSPCQSFSPAVSSNTGFDGKSKLFFEYVRIMRQSKPKWFLLENVIMRKEWRDIISENLGVEPVMIDSAVFSAQSRPRLYWTNIPILPLPESNGDVLMNILEPDVDPKYFYKEDYTHLGYDKVVCAKLHIKGHDILKRVNNVFEKCQTLTAVCGGNQHKKVLHGNRVRKLTPTEYERLQTLPDGYTAGRSDSQRYKMIGNAWTVDVIAHIFKGLK